MKILLILISLVIISGCSITPQEYRHAERLCKSYGGVKIVYGTIRSNDIDVVCGNGSRLEGSIMEVNP